jgi:hypothetical protein
LDLQILSFSSIASSKRDQAIENGLAIFRGMEIPLRCYELPWFQVADNFMARRHPTYPACFDQYIGRLT